MGDIDRHVRTDRSSAPDAIAARTRGHRLGGAKRYLGGGLRARDSSVIEPRPMDEGALVHVDVEHTALGVLEVHTAGPGAAIGNPMVIEKATGLLMASLGC